MAIAVTCETSLPVAVLEVLESPDSARLPVTRRDDVQTTIQVVEGVVYVVADEDEWVLTPGDSATIAAGVPYRRWNAGDGEARWVEVYCGA